MSDNPYDIPVLDFTPERLEDGDTDQMVVKLNNTQLKLEAWSVHANNFRGEALSNTAVNLGDNQTIGGLKTFETSLRINAETGNPLLTLRRDNVLSTSLFGLTTHTLLRRHDTTGENQNEIQIRDDRTDFIKPVRGVDDTHADSFVTKGYLDTNYLSADGGSFEGSIALNADSAFIALNGTNNTNAQLEFQDDGQRSALVFIDNGANALRVRKQNLTTGAISSEIALYDYGVIESLAPHIGVPTDKDSNDLSFVTKGYLDTNYISSTGGRFTGNIEIQRRDGLGTNLVLDAGNPGNAGIFFQREGAAEGQIASVSGQLLIRRTNSVGGSPTDISLTNNVIVASKEVRGVSTIPASHPNSFITKDYFDANNTGGSNGSGGTAFNGGTITDQLSISPPQGTAARLTLDNNSGANAGVVFETGGDIVGVLDANGNRVLTHFRNPIGVDTNLILYGTYANVNKEFRVPTATNSSNQLAAVNKQYIDNLNLGSGSGSDFTETGGTVKSFVDFDENVQFSKDVTFQDDIEVADSIEVGGEIKFFEPAGATLNYSSFRQPIGTSQNYEYLWPTNAPSVGDQLTVKSVNGTEIALEWS